MIRRTHRIRSRAGVLALSMLAPFALRAGEITSITLFGCDAAGNQDTRFRWNSGPVG